MQKLTRQLHLEERVHLLGYRTDIPDMLGAADIFCMPSRREGCGMAALEAMAAGLPLITVRSHGTKTYAEKGESGFCLKGDLVTSAPTPSNSWRITSCSAGRWAHATVPPPPPFPMQTA